MNDNLFWYADVPTDSIEKWVSGEALKAAENVAMGARVAVLVCQNGEIEVSLSFPTLPDDGDSYKKTAVYFLLEQLMTEAVTCAPKAALLLGAERLRKIADMVELSARLKDAD